MRRIMFAILALLCLPYAAAKAEGDGAQWVRPSLWSSCEWWGNCARYRYRGWEEKWVRVRKVYRPNYYDREPRRYHTATRDYREATLHHYRHPADKYEDRDDRGPRCLSKIHEVLSTEHQSEDNAKESAKKLMMAKIQWELAGKYMGLNFAADTRWRCSASNAHDTMSGRLAETAAKLTGRDGQNVRCTLWARPCKAPREK